MVCAATSSSFLRHRRLSFSRDPLQTRLGQQKDRTLDAIRRVHCGRVNIFLQHTHLHRINFADMSGDLASVPIGQLRDAVEATSIPSRSPLATFSNWAQTFECRPERVFAPTTAEQCRQIVELARREGATVHPVGVGHSPSDLACTKGWLVRMAGLNGMVRVGQSSPMGSV